MIRIKEEINRLSEREKEIILFIRSGLENKAIAKKLRISVKTVETHKENIKNKLGLATVKELYEMHMQQIF